VNNASFQTADRGTHIKIVVVSLIASILVMVVGISASTSTFLPNHDLQAHGPVVKASKQIVTTRNDVTVIR